MTTTLEQKDAVSVDTPLDTYPRNLSDTRTYSDSIGVFIFTDKQFASKESFDENHVQVSFYLCSRIGSAYTCWCGRLNKLCSLYAFVALSTDSMVTHSSCFFFETFVYRLSYLMESLMSSSVQRFRIPGEFVGSPTLTMSNELYIHLIGRVQIVKDLLNMMPQTFKDVDRILRRHKPNTDVATCHRRHDTEVSSQSRTSSTCL